MSNTTRTPAGAAVQLGAFFGMPYVKKANTSLNEKFNILKNDTPRLGVHPTARYIGIGNGGHNVEIDDGVAAITGVNRISNASVLYNHMPFIMRRTGDDLTIAKRAKYRMRVIEMHGGLEWISYYIRVIDASDLTPKHTYENVPTDLFPQAPVNVNSVVNPVSVEVEILFSEEEVEEIKQAQLIIHNREGFATISEVGLFTGVDKTIEIAAGEDMDEVICCEMHSSINVGKILDYSTATATSTTLSVGSLDPMYVA